MFPIEIDKKKTTKNILFNLYFSKYTPGLGSSSSYTPGRGSATSYNSGHGSFSTSYTPGRGSTTSNTPGRRSSTSYTPGRRSSTSYTPGRRSTTPFTTPGSKRKTPYTTSSTTPMDVNCSVIVGKHYGGRGGKSNVWLKGEPFVVTLSIFRNVEKLAYGHHKT